MMASQSFSPVVEISQAVLVHGFQNKKAGPSGPAFSIIHELISHCTQTYTSRSLPWSSDRSAEQSQRWYCTVL